MSALLTGCGFQLQGDGRYSDQLASIYIDTADRYSPFYRALVIELEKNGSTVVDAPTATSAQIRVIIDNTGQEVLTVSARNVPTEYDVYYTVSYSVSLQGEEVLPPRTLTSRQDYTFDATQVLGKQREEEALRNALARSLVRQLSQQLARL